MTSFELYVLRDDRKSRLFFSDFRVMKLTLSDRGQSLKTPWGRWKEQVELLFFTSFLSLFGPKVDHNYRRANSHVVVAKC